MEKIRGFPLKAKSFRNTAAYQKLKGGGEFHQPPLYHGGGMTLRVRPRVNTLGCIKAQPFLENIYKSFQYNPSRYVEWQRNISRHFCLAAFQSWICMLMWLLFIRVLEMSYRVNFSPLYQSCPFVTSRLVFQNQRKDKRKHRSLVSSENECKRKRKKKNRKVSFLNLQNVWLATKISSRIHLSPGYY